jgi:succinyl-diaminopimelate desuccinylase
LQGLYLKLQESRFDELIEGVDKLQRQVSRTLSELVQFNTENPPVESYEVQNYVRQELQRVGLKTEFHNPGDNAVALTSSSGEDVSRGLIFYGHADVVSAGNVTSWKYPPYSGKIVDGRVHGRGSADMKAGLAAAIYAYKLLYESEIELPGILEFISVLDEENWHPTPMGWNTYDWLLSTGKLRGRACVMGEPSGISKVCIGERGDYWIRLRSNAKPSHGSMPVYKENACVKLFKCIEDLSGLTNEKVVIPKEIKSIVKTSSVLLRDDLKNVKVVGIGEEIEKVLEHYSMNVGVVSGGTMINILPERCEAEIAFCIPLGSSGNELDRKIRGLLRKEEYANIDLEYLGESQSDPSYTPPKSRLAKSVRRAATNILGYEPPLYVTQGTSDGNVFRKHGIDTCFYGPGSFGGIHCYNESVSIKDTLMVLRTYLRIVENYFGLSKHDR